MAYADLAQRFRICRQIRDEVVRRSRGKLFIEMDDEQMTDAELANQLDLMRRGSNQVWRVLRAQDFDRMRIVGKHDRRAMGGMCMPGRSGNHRLMPEMHAIENADGEEDGAFQLRELCDGMQQLHPATLRAFAKPGAARECAS